MKSIRKKRGTAKPGTTKGGDGTSKESLLAIREGEEVALASFWQDSFNISTVAGLLGFMKKECGERGVQYQMKAFHLPVHEALGGGVHETCQQVVATLGLSHTDVSFYVTNDSNFNAGSIWSGTDDEPDCVVLNRGLIERTPPRELAFVIGHEIGHLIYEHANMREVIKFVYPPGEYEVPPLFAKLYGVWSNVCEISADRVGLLACGDLETAVRALFRLASGLEDRFFSPDLATMLEITERSFAEMARRPDYELSSHPANPVRIKALVTFGQSRLWESFRTGGKPIDDPAFAAAMGQLLDLVRRAPLNEREEAELAFTACAGVFLMQADDDASSVEVDYLNNVLSEYIHWPPAYIDQQIRKGGIMKSLERAAALIVKKYPQRTRELLSRLAPIMVRDRKIHDKEMEIFLDLGVQHLKIPLPEVVDLALGVIRKRLEPMM